MYAQLEQITGQQVSAHVGGDACCTVICSDLV